MARDNTDKFTLIGVGARDSLGQAEDFVNRTGTTFTMLWDSSSASWNGLGITSQHRIIVLNRFGQEVDRRANPSHSWILDKVAGIGAA
ncbi:MAG: hypothetical protein OXG34_00660 [bacterium]|nr:hypothetical protein [bacterium]MCY3888364.1 hypothetical protein [bacterium]MCY3960166.1 hypothetical protein [bacterium]MCY4136096.1 hypothetical protein [bacterium]